jgi:hypothetical protein
MASSVVSIEAMIATSYAEDIDVHNPTTMRTGKYVRERPLKFAKAKVRVELDMPFRGALIVGVDYPVDSFNQLCPAFLSCVSSVSWLMFSSSGLETAHPRWIGDRPRACFTGPRHRGAA